MKLLVGLGNPGAKYEGTRHNIGFMAVDHIARAHDFTPWRARFQGLLAEGILAGEKVALLKPQTFMNLSGQSVGAAVRFWKLAPAEVIVFHDEMDLAPFKVRLKAGGGHAGHNGLRSLHQHIGPDYQRVRLGIGHPGRKEQVLAWVLSGFPRAEAGDLEALLDGIARGAPWLVTGEGSKFQNQLAQPGARAGAVPGQKGQGGRPAKEAGMKKAGAEKVGAKKAEMRKAGAETAARLKKGTAGGAEVAAEKPVGRPVSPVEAQPESSPKPATALSPLRRLLDRFR